MVRQATMSVRFPKVARPGFAPSGTSRIIVALAAVAISSQAIAQQYDDSGDPTMQIQKLEDRLRRLTGQNEELQHRNQLLEQQLRQLQGGAVTPAGAPPQAAAMPSTAAPNQPYGQTQQPTSYERPPVQPSYGQGAYDQGYRQRPAPVQPPETANNGDAFDPARNPNAPGAPRALGGGRLPIEQPAVGAPGGREAGQPLNLSNVGAPSQSGGALPPLGATGGGLTTAPPSQTPRDEFDLGIGYMQRRDYALAEETMRNFTRRYPNDPQVADAQYWLGESFFQRQKYREAAEAFLAVTSKYDTSAKAPDALLRLGQSLAALKEKEAACAALGEVTRKYPHASRSIKQAVDREQKHVKC
jgi:tol-pal system protein YbgF